MKNSPKNAPSPVQFSTEQLNASAESAEQTCASLAPEIAELLVAAWIKAKNAAAVQELAEHGTGKVRTAARRALNVLKAQGVALPEPRRRGVLAPALGEVKAWFLPPDTNGVRVLGFVTSIAGQTKGCLAFFRDDQAVFKVECSTTTASRIFAAMKNAAPGSGLEPIAVPLPWARYKLATCRSVMIASKRTEPLGFMSARGLLEPVPVQGPEHPFDAEGFEFSLDDAKAQASDSGILHHQPEFRSWLPHPGAVQQLLVEVGKHLTPGEEPDQAQVSELLRTEMLAATDRLFTPEQRALLADWMRDAGISLVARGGEELGMKLAATIQCIEAAGLVTNPPQEIPFLRAFFEKAVQLTMARNGGRLNIPIPKASA
jgi:hypothetical protein